MISFKKNTKQTVQSELENKITNKDIESNSKKNTKKKKDTFKFMDEIIGIKDVHDKYIETNDGFTVIMSISTQDFEILNNDEQTAFEDNLIALQMSISFPIKFRTSSKKISLFDFKQLLSNTKLTEQAQIDYRNKMLERIEQIEQSKDVYLRQSYISISASMIDKDKERTIRELESRYQTVLSGLGSANVKSRILTRLEAYQLFFDIFNKNNNLLISDTIKNGSYDLYSQGTGLLFKVDEDTESTNKELRDALEISTKPNEMMKDEDIFTNGTTNVKSLIKPDIWDVQDDYIKLGINRYCRTYTFGNIPRYLHIGFLNEIFSLGMVDISTYIENIPDSLVIKTITAKYNKIKSQISLKEGKGSNIDYDELYAAKDLDNLRELIQTNSDRMFYVQGLVTLWGENLDQLDRKSTLFEDICARKGIKARVLIKDQKEGFITALPLGRNLYTESLRNITTGAAISFFPIGNTELCHKYGVYWGKNMITRSPVSYDQFLGKRGLANSNELTNGHLFICGKAGSGKSTTMKVTSGRKRISGHFLMIIDPEEEYKSYIDKHGGKYIVLKVGEKSGINPFELEVEEDDKGKRYIDLYAKLAEIRSMLSSFVIQYRNKPLEGTELTGFERAFNNLFANRGITKDADSLYEDNPLGVGKIKKKIPILSDLKAELEKDQYTKELAELMNLICGEGSMAIFDCETNPAMNLGTNPLIGVSIKQLDEFTQSFAIKNLFSWIWGGYSNYKYKNLDKDVILDEAWILAKMKEAEYVEHMARRGRKYKIALTVATQMIEEFLNNAAGKAIIGQCATKFIMRQDPAVASEAANYFHLSPSAKGYITSFDLGQGLLITETGQILVQVEMFDFEKEFATT